MEEKIEQKVEDKEEPKEEPYEPLKLTMKSKKATKESAIHLLGSVIKTIRKLPDGTTLEIKLVLKERIKT